LAAAMVLNTAIIALAVAVYAPADIDTAAERAGHQRSTTC